MWLCLFVCVEVVLGSLRDRGSGLFRAFEGEKQEAASAPKKEHKNEGRSPEWEGSWGAVGAGKETFLRVVE